MGGFFKTAPFLVAPDQNGRAALDVPDDTPSLRFGEEGVLEDL